MAEWLSLLKAAIAAHDGEIKAVAIKLGYSRTAISLASRGKYPGKTDKIEKRVLARLGKVECTYHQQTITFGECASMREREAPTHNPLLMRHWSCCQSCPKNPQAEIMDGSTPLPKRDGVAARIPVMETEA